MGCPLNDPLDIYLEASLIAIQQSSNAFYRNTKRYNHNRNERVQWNSIPARNSFTDTRTFDRDTLPPFGGPQTQMPASNDSHQFHTKQT